MSECSSRMYEPRRSKIGSFKEMVDECKYIHIEVYGTNLQTFLAMVTKLWRHSLFAMIRNAYHAPEIITLHTNANFEKSTTWIFQNKYCFLKSFNHEFNLE